LPWYTGDGIRDAGFPAQAQPNDPTALYDWKGVGIGSAETESVDQFDAAYREEYNEAPPSFAPQAYDAAWLAILASTLANVNETSAQEELFNVTNSEAEECVAEDCLQAVLAGESVAYQGAAGPVQFDENGNIINAVYEIWSFTEEGIETIGSVEAGE
jgi:ABC-type branched-subunit amino acid transport system substrate-binding protein